MFLLAGVLLDKGLMYQDQRGQKDYTFNSLSEHIASDFANFIHDCNLVSCYSEIVNDQLEISGIFHP